MGYYRVQQNWRDHYNPLRGLTLQRILSMEEAAERGDQSDVQWFWDHMHQTDVTVASAVEKRLSYIRSLDWEIRTIETADPWLAHEQAQVLRYAYDRIENLTEAASNLAYANFTGFTMLEKIRTGYSKLIKRCLHAPTANSPTRSCSTCGSSHPATKPCPASNTEWSASSAGGPTIPTIRWRRSIRG